MLRLKIKLKKWFSNSSTKTFMITMILTLLAIFALFLIGGCSQINKKIGMADDALIEEISEDFFLDYTGIDIDLTPGTPE